MGFADTFRDFYDSMTFSNELHAEAPENDSKDEGGDDEKSEDSKEEGEGDSEDKDGDEGESKDEDGDEEGGEDKEEEEEEEEEDEPVDPKPQIEAECAKSAQCAPLKHHYEDCAERVHRQEEDPDHKGPKEDCVEEFFHLQHCATQCAAPKLFRALK